MGPVCTGKSRVPKDSMGSRLWAQPASPGKMWVPSRLGASGLDFWSEGRGAADTSSLGGKALDLCTRTREVGFPWMPKTPAHHLHTQKSTSSFPVLCG